MANPQDLTNTLLAQIKQILTDTATAAAAAAAHADAAAAQAHAAALAAQASADSAASAISVARESGITLEQTNKLLKELIQLVPPERRIPPEEAQ